MTAVRKRPKKPLLAVSSSSSDASVDIARLIDIVSAFPRQTIGVIGDFVVDEFVSGAISRVSREAPVLILRHQHTDIYPGGAANAVYNLAALGARVLPVSVVGDDEGGRKLLEYFRQKGVNTAGILRVREWITTTKTRYLAGWTHTTEQQVLRVDREPGAELPRSVQESIERKARKVALDAGAVIISDYGFGAATPSLARKLKNKCIALDSRYRLLEYAGTGICAATPNEPELEVAYHVPIGTDKAKREELGLRLMRELDLQALVVTLGKDGMALFDRDGSSTPAGARYISAFGSDVPVDVTGAGDTVISVFTLALAAGASHWEAAHLANFAGGIVVMKRRTATLSRDELEAALRGEAAVHR